MATTDPSDPLEVDAIGKQFGTLWACRDISLRARRAATTGLLGPNGAGKTTLIRICAGWLAADAGEVRVCGIRQTPQALPTRRNIGITSADAPLYDELTARECLLLSATLHGLSRAESKQRADDLLQELQMDSYRDRRAGRLSTGMAQRLRLACALIHEPAVLLLDEPTASLDLEIRHLVWAVLRRRRDQGAAILLCTHDFQEAAALCDTVHLLVGGKLAATLTGPSAFADLETRYLASLTDT